MEVKAFDTHKYIKELQSSGFDEKQAEVIVKSLLESREYDFSKLSTQEQVSHLEKEIGKLEKNTNERFTRLEKEMTKFATKEQITNLEKNTKAQITNLEKSTKEQITNLEKNTKAQITNLEKSTKEQITNLEKNIIEKFSSFKDYIDTKITASCQTVQNNIIKWVVPLIAIQMLAVFYKIFFS